MYNFEYKLNKFISCVKISDLDSKYSSYLQCVSKVESFSLRVLARLVPSKLILGRLALEIPI